MHYKRAIRTSRILTIPNAITIARAVLGLTVFLWWQPGSIMTYTIIVLAAVSDGLDGIIARQFKQQTAIGTALDPLADKLFILPIFWLVGIVEGNVLLMALALVTTLYDIDNTWRRRLSYALALKGAEYDELPTTLLSKAKTTAQFLLAMLLVSYPNELPTTIATTVVLLLVLASWLKHRFA